MEAPPRDLRELDEDLFHEEIPESYIAQVFDVMAGPAAHVPSADKARGTPRRAGPALPWPENVWMGVTIENRRFVHRADYCAPCPQQFGLSPLSRSSARSRAST